MSLVRQHGALVAVTVTSCRKVRPAQSAWSPPARPLTPFHPQAFSIALSFILFPKPFTPAYLVGGLVFAAGVVLNVYRKNQRDLDAACARLWRRVCGEPEQRREEAAVEEV